jgi:hypothetical protein
MNFLLVNNVWTKQNSFFSQILKNTLLLYLGYIVTFTKVLIIVELIPSIVLLYLPSPHSWNSFKMSHFSIFIHEYIIFLVHSDSFTFSLNHSPSYWYSDRTCFTFLFSVFEKRLFCLFKIAIQGVSLWHFNVHMYYNLNWFIPSIFLLSTLVSFLWWFQQI